MDSETFLSRGLQETEQGIGEPLVELLAGRVRAVEYSGGQVIVDAPRRGRVYLPGSFNPLHEGHRRAPVDVACMRSARTCCSMGL